MPPDEEKTTLQKLLITILFFSLSVFSAFSLFIMIHPRVSQNYRNYYINKNISAWEYLEAEIYGGMDIQERVKPICVKSARDTTC